MPELLRFLFDTSDFTPRWTCGNWTALHGWIHIVSDVATWGAYTAIPFVLAFLVLRRRDLPFPKIFWLFAAFIFTCGTVHLIESVIFWWPIYRVSAITKMATAIASWATVIAIAYAAPKALSLPGLARINENLTREVGDRRRAEGLLRESQDRLQFILSATGVGTWDWNVVTGNVHWSENLQAIHGLQSGKLQGTFATFMEAVHPEDRDRLEQTIRRALRDNNDFSVEYRVNCDDRPICWLEMKGHIAASENGRPIRIAGICLDITNRKMAEQRFRLTVEASPNAVILVDGQGRIVLANSRVKTMFGYEPQELIGQSIEILVPERFRARHSGYREQFHQKPEARPMGAGRDLFALRKDGSEFPVEIGLSPTESEEGLLVLATVVDITSRKSAEQERTQLLEAERAARNEAERANRLKDMFLATVSHELRTPLNAILGWSQLLSRSSLQGESAQAASIIQRNAKVQARLIEDLLDMSRIISGKIRLDMQVLDLSIVVNSAIEAVLPSAQVKNIQIGRDVDSTIGPVRGDPNRLQQVVWNLLTNAIKFTPKGGRVDVSLKRTDAHAQFVVSDTGIGISQEFLPFMFDRFRQADSSTSRQHAGLGLGLSIVKNLVDLHGGTVRAESKGENQGATFVVSLPIASDGKPEEAQEAPTESRVSWPAPTAAFGPQAFGGLKVMVVDDDPDACVLAQRVLEDCGARVATATSADEALGMLEPFAPDLIISDISMPGKDGYQFIKEVRAQESDRAVRTPAAALTALTRPEDRARAALSGYQAHISKPLTAAELIAVVASLTGRISEVSPSLQVSEVGPGTDQAVAAAVVPTRSEFRLLLVEDNPSVSDRIKSLLERQNFVVEAARSIAGAVDLFESQVFDLVLSDVGLPDGSGISLMRQLRARRPVHGIALSGHASDTLVQLCRRAGFSEYLVKSATEPELLAAVNRALGRVSSPEAQT
jgi:PAS domain S-box-containing protein